MISEISTRASSPESILAAAWAVSRRPAWISAAEIQACRLMTLQTAQRIDEGDEARVEISLIKFYAARVLNEVIDRAIQVHGALGLTDDTPLASMAIHARGGRIYDGPDEVHRMVVARRILKAFEQGDGWRFG